MAARFVIEALVKQHEHKDFSCGVFALDRYLKEQATQDMNRRAAMCYVARDAETGKIAGFYTISAGDIALKDMPEDIVRRLPRYPVVPVARVGRLAIDIAFQGHRLGAALLWTPQIARCAPRWAYSPLPWTPRTRAQQHSIGIMGS